MEFYQWLGIGIAVVEACVIVYVLAVGILAESILDKDV